MCVYVCVWVSMCVQWIQLLIAGLHCYQSFFLSLLHSRSGSSSVRFSTPGGLSSSLCPPLASPRHAWRAFEQLHPELCCCKGHWVLWTHHPLQDVKKMCICYWHQSSFSFFIYSRMRGRAWVHATERERKRECVCKEIILYILYAVAMLGG